jgi:hypothetical protein
MAFYRVDSEIVAKISQSPMDLLHFRDIDPASD